MAAVVCTTIGELCSASCNAFSKVICLPCRALNLGCESLGELLCTPFMPYMIVTFALNTPAVVYGVMSVQSVGCSDLFSWLIGNAVLCAIHMVACLYIIKRIQEAKAAEEQLVVATSVVSGKGADDIPSKTEQGYLVSNFMALPAEHHTDREGGANSFQRIKHVLCYDKGMAVYIIVIIIWLVWMSMGIGRRVLADGNDAECDTLINYMNVTIICGYMWMMVVAFAFCCSMLCVR
jgi:hypothetical protein